jgi:hypothetical protein
MSPIPPVIRKQSLNSISGPESTSAAIVSTSLRIVPAAVNF